MIKNSQPFGEKCQKTVEGGFLFDSHCTVLYSRWHFLLVQHDTIITTTAHCWFYCVQSGVHCRKKKRKRASKKKSDSSESSSSSDDSVVKKKKKKKKSGIQRKRRRIKANSESSDVEEDNDNDEEVSQLSCHVD